MKNVDDYVHTWRRWDERSTVAVTSSRIAKGLQEAPSFMLKPAPSPSAAVVGIDERDSGKENVRVESQAKSDNKPVGRTASRANGRGEARAFRSPERSRLSPTAMSACGEADAFDLGEGRDVEGCVFLEGSMLPYIAQPATVLGEVGGIQQLSFVVWPMTCVELWTDICSSSGSALAKASSIGSGELVGEGGGSRLVRKGTNAGISKSCRTACARVVERSSSWM